MYNTVLLTFFFCLFFFCFLFSKDEESKWKGPFYFIQGTDPQFGLMKSWATGDCDFGGDEWDDEIQLTEEAVKAINKLDPKPKFFVLCGDLVHSMPGRCQPALMAVQLVNLK